MASLHITELSGLPNGVSNTDLLAVANDAIQATQEVALGATAVASSAFQANTLWLKLKAGGPCAYAIGANPTAAVGGNFMNTGDTEYVKVPVGKGYVLSAITDTP